MTVNLDNLIQYNATKTTAARTRKKSYQDGFESATGDGINAIAEKWQLVTIPLLNTAVDTVEGELRALMGDSFLWTPPVTGHSEASYRLDSDISRSFLEGNYSTLTFTLKRVYLP